MDVTERTIISLLELNSRDFFVIDLDPATKTKIKLCKDTIDVSQPIEGIVKSRSITLSYVTKNGQHRTCNLDDESFMNAVLPLRDIINGIRVHLHGVPEHAAWITWLHVEEEDTDTDQD
jgi:hypothetical protein